MRETSNILRELISLTNELDQRGLVNEANLLDSFIIKLSSEPNDSESFGELIDLEEYRRKAEGKKPKRRERQDPEYLLENWQELQRAIDDLKREKEHYLIVLEDGETYASDASIVRVSSAELEQIEAGAKIFDFVPPDHESPNAKWTDIWDIVKSEDL